MKDSLMEAATFMKNLRRKTEMLARHFDICASAYDDPITFCAEVESIIQDIRNYTHFIQNYKSVIPEFDEWYGKWQKCLKDDQTMRWVHKTRNSMVHAALFATTSNVELIINDDHRRTIISQKHDVMTSSQQIVSRAMVLAKNEPQYKHATGVIKRNYIFSVNGEERSALEILYYAVNYMVSIFIDLIDHLMQKPTMSIKQIQSAQLEQKLPEELCHLERTFKLKDGKFIEIKVSEMTRPDDDELRKIAENRYGIKVDDAVPKEAGKKDLQEVAKDYMKLARKLLVADGHLCPIVILHSKDDDKCVCFVQVYKDRAEKILFWRGIADYADRNHIDAIIAIHEDWRFTDLKAYQGCLEAGQEPSSLLQKEEGIGVDLICKNGNHLSLSAAFTRQNGKIRLEDTIVNDPKVVETGIYAPVLEKWGIKDSTFMPTQYQASSKKFDQIMEELS